MEHGTVRWFNVSRRFGFIKPNTPETDLFFHGSSVIEARDSDALDSGGTGIAVSFERGTYRGKPVAVNIRIVD